MITTAVALAIAVVSIQPDPLEVYARPQHLVTLPGGRRINILCTGSGGPTVLLEAGWSNSNLAWRSVQPLVARSNRVCSYDRAGLGFSDPASGPRDTVHIVQDLEALLKAAGIKPPYVVVGYSMGGLSARLFTDRNRRDVVGMVLVEASGENQASRFTQVLPNRHPMRPSEACAVSECTAPGPALPASVLASQASIAARPAYQAAMLAELVGMNGDGSAQVAASKRSYGDLPLIVLTGADNVGDVAFSPSERDAFRKVWNGMHEEMSALSTRGVHRQAPGTGHLIVLQRPDLVAGAISEVVEQSQP